MRLNLLLPRRWSILFGESYAGHSIWKSVLMANSINKKANNRQEKTRPIIFICHSLGGLVTKQAMIRLNAYPHLFPAIRLHHCAILFLATPHSGSSSADWNKYLVDLMELIGGLRADTIVNPLRSHNPISATANEDFGNLKIAPRHECFYETNYTKVAGKNLHVSDVVSSIPLFLVLKVTISRFLALIETADRLKSFRSTQRKSRISHRQCRS
jgi:hypothetical protein